MQINFLRPLKKIYLLKINLKDRLKCVIGLLLFMYKKYEKLLFFKIFSQCLKTIKMFRKHALLVF